MNPTSPNTPETHDVAPGTTSAPPLDPDTLPPPGPATIDPDAFCAPSPDASPGAALRAGLRYGSQDPYPSNQTLRALAQYPTPVAKLTTRALKCQRAACGYEWIPRVEIPVRCPCCKRDYWWLPAGTLKRGRPYKRDVRADIPYSRHKLPPELKAKADEIWNLKLKASENENENGKSKSKSKSTRV